MSNPLSDLSMLLCEEETNLAKETWIKSLSSSAIKELGKYDHEPDMVFTAAECLIGCDFERRLHLLSSERRKNGLMKQVIDIYQEQHGMEPLWQLLLLMNKPQTQWVFQIVKKYLKESAANMVMMMQNDPWKSSTQSSGIAQPQSAEIACGIQDSRNVFRGNMSCPANVQGDINTCITEQIPLVGDIYQDAGSSIKSEVEQPNVRPIPHQRPTTFNLSRDSTDFSSECLSCAPIDQVLLRELVGSNEGEPRRLYAAGDDSSSSLEFSDANFDWLLGLQDQRRLSSQSLTDIDQQSSKSDSGTLLDNSKREQNEPAFFQRPQRCEQLFVASELRQDSTQEVATPTLSSNKESSWYCDKHSYFDHQSPSVTNQHLLTSVRQFAPNSTRQSSRTIYQLPITLPRPQPTADAKPRHIFFGHTNSGWNVSKRLRAKLMHQGCVFTFDKSLENGSSAEGQPCLSHESFIDKLHYAYENADAVVIVIGPSYRWHLQSDLVVGSKEWHVKNIYKWMWDEYRMKKKVKRNVSRIFLLFIDGAKPEKLDDWFLDCAGSNLFHFPKDENSLIPRLVSSI